MNIFKSSNGKRSQFVQCSIKGNFSSLKKHSFDKRPLIIDIFNHRNLAVTSFLSGCAINENKEITKKYLKTYFNADIKSFLNEEMADDEFLTRLLKRNKAGENLFLLTCRFADVRLMNQMVNRLKKHDLLIQAIRKLDRIGYSALMFAALGDQTLTRIKTLIEAVNDKRLEEKLLFHSPASGVDVSHILVKQNKVESLKFLLNLAENFNMQEKILSKLIKFNFIQKLITQGDYEKIKSLLETTKSQKSRNHLITSQNENGNSPLIEAFKHNNTKIIISLLYFIEPEMRVGALFQMNKFGENAYFFAQIRPELKKIFNNVLSQDFFKNYKKDPEHSINVFEKVISDPLRQTILSQSSNNILTEAISNGQRKHVARIVKAFDDQEMRDSVIKYPILKTALQKQDLHCLIYLIWNCSKEHKINNLLTFNEENIDTAVNTNILLDVITIKSKNNNMLPNNFMKELFKAFFQDLSADEQIKALQQSIKGNSMSLFICGALTMSGLGEVFEDFLNCLKPKAKFEILKDEGIKSIRRSYESGKAI